MTLGWVVPLLVGLGIGYSVAVVAMVMWSIWLVDDAWMHDDREYDDDWRR